MHKFLDRLLYMFTHGSLSHRLFPKICKKWSKRQGLALHTILHTFLILLNMQRKADRFKTIDIVIEWVNSPLKHF